MSSRYYLYEVTEVYGSYKERVQVGETLIDTNHGEEHVWSYINMDTFKPTGGFRAVRKAFVRDPELIRQMDESRGKS